MVTRSGWLVLVASLVTLAGGRAFALPELYVFGATGIALLLVAVMQARRSLPTLRVERVVHPRRVHLGGSSRVELRITNTGTRRSPVLTLHDPVAGTVGARVSLAPLGPAQTQVASYRLPTERRGLVAVGPLEARRTDPFGLARRTVVVADRAALTVLPAIESLNHRPAGAGLDDPLHGFAHPVRGGAGDEDFATLRPYVVGDDLRRVHWASSARVGDLVVRQDDPPWQGHLTVVLDARGDRIDAERFEVAVTATASLVYAVGVRGDRIRLVITDGTDTGLVDARAGRDTVLEHLAVVQRHPSSDRAFVPTTGRRRSGGLVFITGTPTPGDLAHLIADRSRFATVWLVTIDPSAVGRAADGPLAGPRPGIEVAHVDGATSFPSAWAAAGRASSGRR